MLADAGRDTVGALPVRRIHQPTPDAGQEAHAGLAQGIAKRCAPAIRRSATSAKATVSTVPTTSGVWKFSICPLSIREPSPPMPIRAVIVTMPLVETGATR